LEIKKTVKKRLTQYIRDKEDGYKHDHDEKQDELKKFEEIREHPLGNIVYKLKNISTDMFFITELYEYKVYFLSKAILSALEDNNPLSLANNARSLMEQIAVFSYIADESNDMIHKLKNQCTEDKINLIIDKTKERIDRVYYGKGMKSKEESEYKAIHINVALTKLSQEFENAFDLYDYFCEYVHPNFGNNELISSGQIGR